MLPTTSPPETEVANVISLHVSIRAITAGGIFLMSRPGVTYRYDKVLCNVCTVQMAYADCTTELSAIYAWPKDVLHQGLDSK